MGQDMELIVARAGPVGRIRLNRPRALNALNLAMYRGLYRVLTDWAADPAVGLVLIEGEGERAFCAGGDIRALWEYGQARDMAAMEEIFRTEYAMNRLINRFPKPYVAVMDGITMGGGCGVSVHGSHRIVTERTLIAMLETAIGFFPDVGASWFLSRCPGGIGPYLGLTGKRIGAADALAAGLADTYIPSEGIAELVTDLAAGTPVGDAIAARAETPDPPVLGAIKDGLERCFARPGSVTGVLESLAAEEDTWAREAEAMMAQASPFSLAVALAAIRRGAGASIEDCMTMEYRICRRFLDRDELFEGIRAAVVDKDRNPKWADESPQAVDPQAVEACFAPLDSADLRFD